MWQRLFFHLFIIRCPMWKHCYKRGKIHFVLSVWGKQGDMCYMQRKQTHDGIKGLHKVALRNTPGSGGVFCFLEQLLYIIKTGICICPNSVAS